jgi:hypothetical protein
MAIYDFGDSSHIEFLLNKSIKITKIQEILDTFEGSDRSELVEEWVSKLSGSTIQEEIKEAISLDTTKYLDWIDRNVLFYSIGRALKPLDVLEELKKLQQQKTKA